MDVADQRVALLLEVGEAVGGQQVAGLGGVLHAVHAHVDHHCARLDVLRPDEPRAPDRRDEDVRLTAHRGELRGPRVTHRHRRVGVGEQHGHGLADDVAAPDHDRAPARHRNLVPHEQLDDPGRGAGHEAWPLLHESAHVLGVESVHVLGRVDEVEHARGVDLARQRQLDEDAVDVGATVQLRDDRRDLFGRRARPEAAGLASHPELLARPGLASHVHRGGGVVADEHDTQPGPGAGGRQPLDLPAQLLANGACGGRPVQQPRAHLPPPFPDATVAPAARIRRSRRRTASGRILSSGA